MLDKMLQLLVELRDDPTFTEVVPKHLVNIGYYTYDLDPRVQEILCFADKLLITNDGHPNWGTMEELKHNGFRIRPGEVDSFGWLSALINIPGKGEICYG